MYKNSISLFVLIFLGIFSQIHTLFGKNLKKWIWWLSIISSILFGFYLGFLIAPFPQSIIVGIVFSISTLVFTLWARWTRKRHDY
jgi:hypothetical protein